MEEIKVGEYIRTKKGLIEKVLAYQDLTTYDGNKLSLTLHSYDTNKGSIADIDIAKHSFNIIDLIEVGDYVNGERIFATDNRINDNGEKVILAENYDDWTDNGVVSNKDIKTILTKEQYKANCYEV